MARKTRSTRPGTPRLSGVEPSAASAQKAIFRKEGEFWTVGVGGKVFQLKDSKGLAYLAHLLRYPASEFHVLDLPRALLTGPAKMGCPVAAIISKRRDSISEALAMQANCLMIRGEECLSASTFGVARGIGGQRLCEGNFRTLGVFACRSSCRTFPIDSNFRFFTAENRACARGARAPNPCASFRWSNRWISSM